MARQNKSNATESVPTGDAANTESNESTDTSNTGEQANTSTEAEAPIDLTAFQSVVNEAVGNRDTSTGVVSEADLAKVTTAYRELDGAKPKNAGKDWVGEQMLTAVQSLDGPLARAYSDAQKALVAGGTSKKTKAPTDPKAALIERRAAFTVAQYLLDNEDTPEGLDAEAVTNEAQTLAESLFADAVKYQTWATAEVAEGEERPEAPEVSPVVRSAFKLFSGKASGGGRVSGGSGVRRDVSKHVAEVFANVEPGVELTMAEIANTPTSEYPKDSPVSQGAVSARLFPSSGKCTIEGIEPLDKTGDKPRRARRTA